jgi:transposase
VAISSARTWSEYLDELENSLDLVERALDDMFTSAEQDEEGTDVPSSIEQLTAEDAFASADIARLGQLPQEYAERTSALLDRQDSLVARVREVQAEIRSHLGVVSASSTRMADAPVYLDTSG